MYIKKLISRFKEKDKQVSDFLNKLEETIKNDILINEMVEKFKNEVEVVYYNIVKSEESQLDETHLYIHFNCEQNKDINELIKSNFRYHIDKYDLEFYHLYDSSKICCYLDLTLKES